MSSLARRTKTGTCFPRHIKYLPEMTAPKDPENSCVIRGHSLTRSKHNINYLHMQIAPTIRCRSFLTTDTIPRSLSPSSRTSIYAANLQKAHQSHLESPLSNIEGLSEYPEVHCVVTSMPYTNSKCGLSGHYSGMMDYPEQNSQEFFYRIPMTF